MLDAESKPPSPVAGAAAIPSRPSAQESRPSRLRLEPDSTPTMPRPSTVSMKSSAEENARMIGRATTMNPVSTSAPNRPPSIRLKNAAESARAASPRFAIGKPSRIVAPAKPRCPGFPSGSS